jgi:TM2 domain-containing membrane protein YozV
MNAPSHDTHRKTIGYLLWLFGFTGSHRFYYGRPVTGTPWFFTFGLLWLLTGGLFLVGWLYDFRTLNGQVDETNRRDPGLAVPGSVGRV